MVQAYKIQRERSLWEGQKVVCIADIGVSLGSTRSNSFREKCDRTPTTNMDSTDLTIDKQHKTLYIKRIHQFKER